MSSSTEATDRDLPAGELIIDFGGNIEVRANPFVRERTGVRLRYYVDPKTGVRGPRMQYEEKTVERRVWTRPAPVTLTVDTWA